MKKRLILSTFLAGALASANPVMAADGGHQYTILANKPGAVIQPTMYGVFFEDINYGADGGLYADLVENRSFEFPQRLMGWQTFGNAEVEDDNPAFERNPHYIRLKDDGHTDKWTGIENRGYFGMGFKKGLDYRFGVYARSNGNARIRVELVSSHNEVIAKKSLEVSGKDWKKYTIELKPAKTDAHGLLRIFLESKDGLDMDHLSLFPSDAWAETARTAGQNRRLPSDDVVPLPPGKYAARQAIQSAARRLVGRFKNAGVNSAGAGQLRARQSLLGYADVADCATGVEFRRGRPGRHARRGENYPRGGSKIFGGNHAVCAGENYFGDRLSTG